MHSRLTVQPRISIGMPVRNGEAHIARAIHAFLDQTFADFELTVYDNASTDATAAIVTSLAAVDARVSLVRHDCDIGGAANFIHAAAHAQSPLFCWAAHDDLREPRFLQAMVDLLETHDDVSLACCAVRNIDPDGTLRDVRPETRSLRTTCDQTPAQRLRMYLREVPGTPFYGLFKTGALHNLLPYLRELDRLADNGPALLGIDMLVLARFLREHGLAVSHEPLILFRRGGVSHSLARYGSLRGYCRQLWIYQRELRRATMLTHASLVDRVLLIYSWAASVVRWLFTRDMRRMTAVYLKMATPLLDTPRAWLAARREPSLRRLRARLATFPASPRTIVLFGAGKHTRSRWRMLQRAAGRRHTIIACCDDRAADCQPIDGLRIVAPAALSELKPDVLLVSSDTYERAMFERACAIAPYGTAVWSLYDASLDTSDMSSTDSMNASTFASASPPEAAS